MQTLYDIQLNMNGAQALGYVMIYTMLIYCVVRLWKISKRKLHRYARRYEKGRQIEHQSYRGGAETSDTEATASATEASTQ